MTARTGGAAAVLLAALVVLAETALVAAWLVFLLRDEGWSRLLWLVVGGLVAWRLVPRPGRPDDRAVPVTAEEAPALHRLVARAAEQAGTRPPSRVLLDTTYPVAAHATGYLGKTSLVVGLPQWSALSPSERVAALVHVLGCARPQVGPAGVLVRLADDLLTAARTILVPTSVVRAHEAAIGQTTAGYGEVGPGGMLVANRLARETSAAVGAAGMAVVAAPVRLLQQLLGRLWRPAALAAARDADARAATVAGPQATLSMLASTAGVPRGLSAAQNAARTRGTSSPPSTTPRAVTPSAPSSGSARPRSARSTTSTRAAPIGYVRSVPSPGRPRRRSLRSTPRCSGPRTRRCGPCAPAWPAASPRSSSTVAPDLGRPVSRPGPPATGGCGRR
ncbi:M48 family metallopeptidase [Phycicoccus flavus]|uniref:M48 family metallopeptidase n=1 Tax=Phycicoccus flavus TaxID=2502783 RepID=UPI000FEBFBDB|nr:M48 family metallopeptidase [Phycicoccus flavus]NHA67334.1 hypothetical protein [Phycicoccus flavus]